MKGDFTMFSDFRIRRLRFLSGVLLAAFACPYLGHSQQINEKARAVGVQWLYSNCEAGEEGRLEAQLLQFKVDLEPFFLEALRRGPDDKETANLQRSAEARYTQRQELLKSGQGLPMSEADLNAARSVTLQQYVEQEKQDFNLRYKSQAASGLGIVGGPKAKAALEPIAKDDKSPLKGSAQAA